MDSRELPEQHDTTFNDIPNELLIKYIKNKVDLELARELAVEDMNSLQHKRTSLIEEKKKLNDLHQRVFLMNNDLCESVWKFSNKHHFPRIIHSYLNGRMATGKTQLYHRDEFERLEREFQVLSTEIANIRSNLQELSDRTNLINMKQELCTYAQSPTLKLEFSEDPKVHNDIPSSKFSVKKPSSISKLFNKR